MRIKNTIVKKTCSFYASEYHLSTILLPYTVQNIEENIEIKTFLEDTIDENMNNLIKTINLDEKTKNQIKRINWESNSKLKFNEIRNELEENKEKYLNIIITGTENHINEMNSNIERWINKYNKRAVSIVINNCYLISETIDFPKILSMHDSVLNTSGETDIKEVLGYGKEVSNF